MEKFYAKELLAFERGSYKRSEKVRQGYRRLRDNVEQYKQTGSPHKSKQSGGKPPLISDAELAQVNEKLVARSTKSLDNVTTDPILNFDLNRAYLSTLLNNGKGILGSVLNQDQLSYWRTKFDSNYPSTWRTVQEQTVPRIHSQGSWRVCLAEIAWVLYTITVLGIFKELQFNTDCKSLSQGKKFDDVKKGRVSQGTERAIVTKGGRKVSKSATANVDQDDEEGGSSDEEYSYEENSMRENAYVKTEIQVTTSDGGSSTVVMVYTAEMAPTRLDPEPFVAFETEFVSSMPGRKGYMVWMPKKPKGKGAELQEELYSFMMLKSISPFMSELQQKMLDQLNRERMLET